MSPDGLAISCVDRSSVRLTVRMTGLHFARVPFKSKLGSHFDPSVEYSHLLAMVSPVITTVPRSLKGFPATTVSAVQVQVLPFTIALSEPVFPALSKNRDV